MFDTKERKERASNFVFGFVLGFGLGHQINQKKFKNKIYLIIKMLLSWERRKYYASTNPRQA
jgi:hypothetical protein